jgi:hypothetical protein
MRSTFLLTAVLAIGCGYKSDYAPPRDGRARGIWSDDKLVVVKPAELPRCRHEVPPPIAQQYAYWVPRDQDGYYVPPSSGPGVVIIVVGPPPPLLLPPLPPGPIPAGGLDGEGAKYIFVAMAVVAIVAFPFVAVGLAVGHPEPSDEVVTAIDTINRYNDDARRKEALCAATAPPAEAP